MICDDSCSVEVHIWDLESQGRRLLRSCRNPAFSTPLLAILEGLKFYKQSILQVETNSSPYTPKTGTVTDKLSNHWLHQSSWRATRWRKAYHSLDKAERCGLEPLKCYQADKLVENVFLIIRLANQVLDFSWHPHTWHSPLLLTFPLLPFPTPPLPAGSLSPFS